MADALDQLPPVSHRERLARVSRTLDPVRALWERAYPWLGGIAFGILCSRATITDKMFAHVLSDVLPPAVSVASIFAGLQGAMHAILLSMLKSRAARTLKQRNYWGRLVGYVRLGILSLVVFVTLGMAAIVANAIDKCPTRYGVITSSLVGLFVFSILASLRIMLLEIKMLLVPDDDREA